MKIVISAHSLQTAITKEPIIADLEDILAIIFNKLDTIDSKEKGFSRLFEYTVKIVQTEE